MKRKMRAALLYKPLDIRIEEIEIPKIKPDEVLVKIERVGICGSDVHYYLHGRIASFIINKPLILGHECAGRIAKIGDNIDKLKEGDRVVIEPGFPCRKCTYCKEGRYNLCRDVKFYGTPPDHGVFSEYTVAPATNVYSLPNNISYDEGSLIEPLAVGMMAAKRGKIQISDKVAILGAGPIGQMSLKAVKACGAMETYVTDIVDYRLDYAYEAGADNTINPLNENVVDRIDEITKGKGVDLVIEASGAVPALSQAFDIVKPGGRIVLVGIHPSGEYCINLAKILTKELDIYGVWRYANIFEIAIKKVSLGVIDLKSLITHRFKFDEITKGFEIHSEKKGHPMKIQIEM